MSEKRDYIRKKQKKDYPGNSFIGGENDCCSKLLDDEVIEIMSLLSQGTKQVDIAFKFNISQANVSAIKKGVSWAHLTKYPNTREKRVDDIPRPKVKFLPLWYQKQKNKMLKAKMLSEEKIEMMFKEYEKEI